MSKKNLTPRSWSDIKLGLDQKTRKRAVPNKNKPGRKPEHTEAWKEECQRSNFVPSVDGVVRKINTRTLENGNEVEDSFENGVLIGSTEYAKAS